MPGKTWQLFVKRNKEKTTIISIDKDAKITELRKKVSEISGINGDDLRVLFHGQELKANNENGKSLTLADYNIKKDATLRFGDSETETEEQPKMYDSKVQLTEKRDMFTLDDTEGGLRTEMPCGHAISPESLTQWCRSLLSAGIYRFRCPHKDSATAAFCGHDWEYLIIKRFAVLNTTEQWEFEIKIAENYLRKAVGIQECPKCESLCQRKSQKDKRVICPICTRKEGKLYEFCWLCLKTWLTSGTKDCGNFGCTGKDPRLRVIENCSKKPIFEVQNCPEIRACPKCGLLIEHKEECKHMRCPCGQRFCFICLQVTDSGGIYQCGAWNSKCTVAPVQTTIPGN